MQHPTPEECARAKQLGASLSESIARIVRGKADMIEEVVTALVAGGHVLIEDLPGTGKTTFAYSLARSIAAKFSRIQFTSDLLPSDITGVSVYDPATARFNFQPGPVFANIVLADEINRTTPKTQSALLEVMDRAKVTVDGVTHDAGAPFMVFATQNPVDFQGTFPLPESQMDRFFMRVRMGYPDFESELQVMRQAHGHYDQIALDPVLTQEDVTWMQALSRRVFVEESLLRFMLRIITATRTEPLFKVGVSPRGSVALFRAVQAHALMNGRHFATPEDVARVLKPVCVHRLTLHGEGGDPIDDRKTVGTMLDRMLAAAAAPL